jgi:hypothetical protein
MVVKSYGIIQDQAKLPNTIKVVKGKEDNLTKPANNIIKIKDKNVIKPAEKACLCLSGLARETFVPDKDNKSKVKFI